MNLPCLKFSFALLALVSGCASSRPYFSSEVAQWKSNLPDSSQTPVFSAFLIGDAGYADSLSPVFISLSQEAIATRHASGVFFLGDNVYQAGIPPLDDPSRAQAEARLEAQVHRLDGYPGKVHFIPGNHDWNISRAGGRAAILREGQWLEERLGHPDVLLPANACGDPHVLALTPDLTAIFIDSEWYLHDWEKESHQNEGCALQSREAFSRNLKDIVLAQGDKEIVILMHHPPFTQGEHGGKFSLQEHLFPLRVIDPHLWIPLPVIGSLPILLRKAGFSRQDRSNAHYQNLVQAVMEATDGAPHVVFASGHDHNLQLFEEAGHTFVVSGSGSKSNYVAKNGRARFTSRLPGWARLDYYPQGHVWISYFTPEPEGTGTRLLFRHPIR